MHNITFSAGINSLRKNLERHMENYDECRGMIASTIDGSAGYHTKLSGRLHHIETSTSAAASIYFLECEEWYDKAKKMLNECLLLQDTREDSPTFGLWPYYAEETCDEMIEPDYNMADFNARHLVYLLTKKREFFDEVQVTAMTEALYAAAVCSMRRNVSADYTNMSMMSLNTIIPAGELCGNAEFFEQGKERLRTAHKYNMHCSAFSEFNCPGYTPLAIGEIGRMLHFFEDKECRTMADDLNRLGWEMLLSHYHKEMGQVAAPNMRVPRTINGDITETILFIGTGGRFGQIDEERMNFVDMYIAPPVCPEDLVEKYLVQGIEKPVFYDRLYYKTNNIRSKGEDTVIVRNVDSPDLRYFTYMAQNYTMGAFEATDTWSQKRSNLIYWGEKGSVKALRLTCFNDEYAYSSGMVYTNQLNNVQLIHTGFVTDRGNFHYIIDKVKDGKLTTEKLLYVFMLEGDCQNVRVTQNGNRFTVEDKGITIDINIVEALFDGEPMTLRYNADKCRIEAVCFCGGGSVDFNKIKNPTYMVATIAVNAKVDIPESAVWDGLVKSKLNVDGKILTLESPALPVGFDKAMETAKSHKE